MNGTEDTYRMNPAGKLTLPRIEAMLRAGRVLFLPLGGDGPRWTERLADDTAPAKKAPSGMLADPPAGEGGS